MSNLQPIVAVAPEFLKKELLSVGEVAWLMSLSPRTIHRLVKADRFPQPIRFNRKNIRWRRDDVLTHIRSLQCGG